MTYKIQRRQAKLKEICGKHVYPWLRDVGKKFKEFGAFPISLSDYYSDPMDKQIAEFFSLIIPENNKQKYITILYNQLGHSLWERIKNRDFLAFSDKGLVFGNTRLSRTKVYGLLDWLWEVCCVERVPLEYVVLGELGIVRRYHSAPLKGLVPTSFMTCRLETILAKMTLRDGFGCGLWHFLPEESLPCPLDEETYKVLSIFYPIKNDRSREGASRIFSFMGFDRDIDFLYAAWGYLYIKKRNPEAAAAFEKKLNRWFKDLRIRENLKVELPTSSID